MLRLTFLEHQAAHLLMFDAKAFLVENFRTPAELATWLRSYGVTPPKDDTIYKWFLRGSVPSDWLGVLVGLLEVERGEVVVPPYVRLPT